MHVHTINVPKFGMVADLRKMDLEHEITKYFPSPTAIHNVTVNISSSPFMVKIGMFNMNCKQDTH